MADVKRHNSTILFSLKDADVSIRRRALDLVCSMCDYSNCRETTAELLTYLAAADYSLRDELVLKVAILAERFADDYAWCAPPGAERARTPDARPRGFGRPPHALVSAALRACLRASCQVC